MYSDYNVSCAPAFYSVNIHKRVDSATLIFPLSYSARHLDIRRKGNHFRVFSISALVQQSLYPFKYILKGLHSKLFANAKDYLYNVIIIIF